MFSQSTWFLLGFVWTGIYFLPTVVACIRGKIDSTGIFIANLFTGVTIIGWVACMIWACMTSHDEYVKNQEKIAALPKKVIVKEEVQTQKYYNETM
jgi:hypothetical protein